MHATLEKDLVGLPFRTSPLRTRPCATHADKLSQARASDKAALAKSLNLSEEQLLQVLYPIACRDDAMQLL